MNWIIDFLIEYGETPKYMHTLGQDAILFVILMVMIGIVSVAVMIFTHFYIKWIDKK